VLPGKLHLYDVETEQLYTINTEQGDSEIVLVEADVVFYRVSDRLYSVSLRETGLGEPRLLCTDELIRDAHWAFMKP
jgi:hypothetical protein